MKELMCTFLTYYIVCFTPSNANGFSSHQLCSAMPQEGEDCNVSLSQWYYDTEAQKCKNFMYGDCPQSENNFNSEEECRQTCMMARTKPSGTRHTNGKGGEQDGSNRGQQSRAGIRPTHKAPKKTGVAGGYIGKGGGEEGSSNGPGYGEGSRPKPGAPEKLSRVSRWTDPCRKSGVGCSKRHKNSFVDCEDAVVYDLPLPCGKQALRRSCSAMPEEGECEILNLWYYDRRRFRCRKFREGDCEGKHSFFVTKDECLDTCQGKKGSPRRRCFAISEEGDCDAVIRWYYKPKRNECRKFDDRDCEGDNAFFKTKDECLRICQGASNEPGSTGHTNGSEGEALAPSTSGQGKEDKQEKGQGGSKQNGGAVATKRPETIAGHSPKYTRPMSTISTRKGLTEAQRRIAEAKRRREQLRKELEAKRKEQSRKPHIKGSCGSRPRKGTCDVDTEKWWFDGMFRVCNRVKQGECTNHGAFFESCRDCMNRCNPPSYVEYWQTCNDQGKDCCEFLSCHQYNRGNLLGRDVHRCIYWE